MLRGNCLLKQVIEGKTEGRIEVTKDEKEAVNSYWTEVGLVAFCVGTAF